MHPGRFYKQVGEGGANRALGHRSGATSPILGQIGYTFMTRNREYNWLRG